MESTSTETSDGSDLGARVSRSGIDPSLGTRTAYHQDNSNK
jgi:hypothetical protein